MLLFSHWWFLLKSWRFSTAGKKIKMFVSCIRSSQPLIACQFWKISLNSFFYKTPPRSCFCFLKTFQRKIIFVTTLKSFWQYKKTKFIKRKLSVHVFFQVYVLLHLALQIFIIVAGLTLVILWKKRLRHRYILVNFVKFWRTPILCNFCKRLLLNICVRKRI